MIQEINDIQAAAAYRSQWSELVTQTPSAGFPHTLEWLECYWKHFGGPQKLRLLLHFEDEQLRGIMPLSVKSEKMRGGVVQVLGYTVDGWVTFFGPVGPNAQATLTEAIQHISQSPTDYDLLDLRFVDRSGADAGATVAALHATNFAFSEDTWASSAEVDLSLGWDAYWSSRSSKHRNNVRRSKKKLAQLGQVSFESYIPERGEADPRWDLYEECLDVAKRSWQSQSTDGTTLCSPEIAEFLRDSHEVGVQQGCISMHLLRLDGQPIAYAYNYRWGSEYFGLRLGFDAALAKFGPGAALMADSIRACCDHGGTVLNLGVDSLDGKRVWQSRVHDSYHYCHYAPGSVRGQLVRLKRSLLGCWNTPDAKRPALAAVVEN